MTVEYASPGTLSGDEALPSVIRLFLFADENERSTAADRIREFLDSLELEVETFVYEDEMPVSESLKDFASVWRQLNPGQAPGDRTRQRISVIVPGMTYAELADLSGPVADSVVPGWHEGHAVLPCQVSVGRADEAPGQAPIIYENSDNER